MTAPGYDSLSTTNQRAPTRRHRPLAHLDGLRVVLTVQPHARRSPSRPRTTLRSITPPTSHRTPTARASDVCGTIALHGALRPQRAPHPWAVSYTHLRAHETLMNL
eukprot:5595229-Prymnesium_polylepis.2